MAEDASDGRRIRRSKRSLKSSLLLLMKTRQLREITVREIAENVDVSRATFYKYYRSKEGLLAAITDEVVADFTASCRNYLVNIPQPKNPKGLADLVFGHFLRNADFYSVIFDSTSLPGFQKRIVDVLKSLAMEDLKYLHPRPAMNIKLRNSFQAYAVLGMIVEWAGEGFKHSPDYMADQLLEIVRFTEQAASERSGQHSIVQSQG